MILCNSGRQLVRLKRYEAGFLAMNGIGELYCIQILTHLGSSLFNVVYL